MESDNLPKDTRRNIIPVEGSIFDFSRAEGIAIFIKKSSPIRLEAQEFLRYVGVREPRPSTLVLGALPKAVGIVKYLAYFNNSEMDVSLDVMHTEIFIALDALNRLGARTVAMNGIFCDKLPDKAIRPSFYSSLNTPEPCQKWLVEDYLDEHPNIFDKIFLVDLRGGFIKWWDYPRPEPDVWTAWINQYRPKE